MENTFLTRSEVAELLRVKYVTVYKWEKKGIIKPAFHVNNRPRYSLECINKVTESQNKKTESQ